jgi:AbrB family looped-hinge helix DNA binding protein
MFIDMKTLATMVTERGQVSIPAQIRKQLHLKAGQRVIWEPISDHACRIVAAPDRAAPGAVAMLGHASTFRTPRRTRAWMAELREGDTK